MAVQWYLLKEETVSGPLSRDSLRKLATSGRIQADDQVRKGKEGVWAAAGDVPWLERALNGDSSEEIAELPPLPSRRRRKPASKPPASKQQDGLPRSVILACSAGAAMVLMVIVGTVLLSRGGETGEPEIAAAADVEPESSVPVVEQTETLPGGDVSEQDMLSEEDAQDSGDAADDAETDESEGEHLAAIDHDQPKDSPEEPNGPMAPDEPPVAAADPDPAVEPPDLSDVAPEPVVPPVPKEKKHITDDEIRDFDGEIRHARRARDAFARYTAFSQSYIFTEQQQEAVAAELELWKQRAEDDLYRLGSDWVTLAEVESARKEANELIQQAGERIGEVKLSEAVELLEEANRANPNGIKAAYVLGLLYSLPFAGINGPEKAERYFQIVLRRHPDHAAALNSLAIAQVKQRQYGPAIANWERVADQLGNPPEVVQNVGRFLHLVQTDRLAANDPIQQRFEDLQGELAARVRGASFEAGTGWLHMIPVFPADERGVDQQAEPVAETHDDLVACFFGTGFVIAPEFVLTNRHVVYDDDLGVADAVGVPATEEGGQDRLGHVAAVSKTTDLALVRIPGLDRTPLRLRRDAVGLATDVMILGYPRGDLLGRGLKATRGIVSAIPDVTRQNVGDYYLFDASADHGNSGGPVLDREGQVIALLTMGYTEGARLTGGIPSPEAWDFAEEHIADLEHVHEEVNVKAYDDWAAMTGAVAPSVLHLTCYYRAGVPTLQASRANQASGASIFEDRTCPRCIGRSRLTCRRRGCAGGTVSEKYYVTRQVGVPPKVRLVQVARFRKKRCGGCGGAGHVDCPDCSNGFDRALR
ncbi:putative periplasmic serine endoprotease DegP-like precursor [Maioricimonas rarisocia]|uniref:Putative periplasmic serine endoprotease DegP-like n=1 Tax=Maioricimonas rarisocia TaxID=2528026 RepID=A0A517Z9Q2_9PLAN|nr:trypsin-like peptidase domain-containing protein [Maioricimonas rarisocia]QDU39216.1 putative periplasmic serine endoprotease DegP-like precursor [Maioricimonas rarisocia]